MSREFCRALWAALVGLMPSASTRLNSPSNGQPGMCRQRFSASASNIRSYRTTTIGCGRPMTITIGPRIFWWIRQARSSPSISAKATTTRWKTTSASCSPPGLPVPQDNGSDLSKIESPEMYFGMLRLKYLASPETPREGPQAYSAPADVPLNNFALVGNWTVDTEDATLAQDQGAIVLHFNLNP
jgi:thioredoxin family protein